MPPSSSARRSGPSQTSVSSPPLPAALSSPLAFDASAHTLVELREWIAIHQSAADERKQREEEDGTAAKRNKAFYERHVRRVQQRLRQQQDSAGIDSEDAKAAPREDVQSLPLISAATRTSRHRSVSAAPTSTASHTAAASDRKRRQTQTVAAAERDTHSVDSRPSTEGGKKRRRAESAESSTSRPSKRLLDKQRSSRVEGLLDDARMDDEMQAAELALSSPTRPPPASRPSTSSPSSAGTAYLDPTLLRDSAPPRRAAVPATSPHSSVNVFQTEQSPSDQLHPGGDGHRLRANGSGNHKRPSQDQPSLLPSSPAIAAERVSSSLSSFMSPSSSTGLRNRLSSFLPSLLHSLADNNQHAVADSSQAAKHGHHPQRQQQQQQPVASSEEVRATRLQQDEARVRLAAVQRQLDEERQAKEEAEKEKRRLIQRVQEMERERQQEVEQRTPSRQSHAHEYKSPAHSRHTSTSTPARAVNAVAERDELGSLKAPVGFFARWSAACRRAAAFLLRLSAVLLLLLLALMALQTSPVRRLLGLERDTLFCPSASLPSAMDGMYHGALVRVAGKTQCTACPANGWCDAVGHLQCDATYVRQNNLCVKDGVWLHRALYFKEQGMALLREQLGRYECGEASQRGMTGEELLQSMKFVPWWEQLLKSAGPPTESEKEEALKQFVYAMRLVEQDTLSANVAHRPIHDMDVLNTTYAAVSGTHPLLCSIRLTAWQHKRNLLLAGLAWCAASYLYILGQRWLWRRRVRPLLRRRVIAMLQDKAGQAVAIDHVRDELWLGQDSAVWERVVADMEADTRAAPLQSKFGQISRPSWRWVGPLPSSGGNAGGSQKRSDIAPVALPALVASAPVPVSLPERNPATQPAVAAAMFAPPHAAFSAQDLSATPTAAPQDTRGCVIG